MERKLKMKILLTAFEPFGGETVNPAIEAVKICKDEILGASIHKLILPTAFREAYSKAFEEIEDLDPDIVLSVGQAGGRSAISLEFVAINYMEARIEDNKGFRPKGESIFEDGKNAYFTNLPIKNMICEIRAAGIPATISYSAGTFVCNELFYSILYYAEREDKKYKAGFMHVPYAGSQVLDKANMPFMNTKDMAIAIEAAIKGALLKDVDSENLFGELS